MRDLSQVLSLFNITIAPLQVNHLRLDSRQVQTGDVFIAIKGHEQDGGQFCHMAQQNGAAAIIADSQCELNIDAEKCIVIEQLNDKLAQLAAAFYQHPSKQLSLIGVTGTNGKSTTTAMIAQLAAGCQQGDAPNNTSNNSAVIGTLGWGNPNALTPLANTTPSCVELQQILAQLQQQQTNVVAMEVSSHGLAQGRTAQSQFKAAVFTNLSRDHLDYHGTMQHYANAKAKLIAQCQHDLVVLNQDDATAQQWIAQYNLSNLVCYGRKNTAPQSTRYVYFSQVKYHPQGIEAQLETSWGNATVNTPLFGEFNLYNLCAAFATLLGLGYSLSQLVREAQKLEPVAGRMQLFSAPISASNKPNCVVDYAHTPEALALALQALQQHVPSGVVCVFGCGGDRDKGKRPLMAQAAEKYANRIVVTSDNPRTEDPNAILADIATGFSLDANVSYEVDRATAIATAIAKANSDEIVLIAGKGHEDYQIIGKQIVPFCDRTWVNQQLNAAEEAL